MQPPPGTHSPPEDGGLPARRGPCPAVRGAEAKADAARHGETCACPCAQCAHRCAPAQVCVCAAVLASEGPGGGSGQRSEGTGTSVPLDSSCSCLAVSPDHGVRSGPSRGRWVRCAAEAEGPSARVCCLLQRPGQLMEGPQRADRSQHSVTSASPGPARGRLPRLQWGSVCLPRFWSKASRRGPCGVAVRGGRAGWLCVVTVSAVWLCG